MSCNLGTKIHHYRQRQTLTLAELANRARIPARTLEEIENGKWFPRLDQLERLLLALDLSWQQLVSEKA